MRLTGHPSSSSPAAARAASAAVPAHCAFSPGELHRAGHSTRARRDGSWPGLPAFAASRKLHRISRCSRCALACEPAHVGLRAQKRRPARRIGSRPRWLAGSGRASWIGRADAKHPFPSALDSYQGPDQLRLRSLQCRDRLGFGREEGEEAQRNHCLPLRERFGNRMVCGAASRHPLGIGEPAVECAGL